MRAAYLPALATVIVTIQGCDVVNVYNVLGIIANHDNHEHTRAVFHTGPFGILVWLSLPAEDVKRDTLTPATNGIRISAERGVICFVVFVASHCLIPPPES
jgi:hypothetical protein